MWLQIAIIAGQLAFGHLTKAGVFSKRPSEISFDEVVKNNAPSEIRPVPYVGGTVEITPSRIWFGDFSQRAVERDSHWSDYLFLGPFAPLLDTLTVAYRFYIGEIFALGYGPEIHVERVTIDDRPVYAATIGTDNAGGGFLIDDPQAWGGDQPPGEGGQYSWCDVSWGDYSHPTNAYWESLLTTPPNKTEALRGITALTSRGRGGAVPFAESGYFAAGGLGYIPRLRLWKVRVRRQPNHLATGFHQVRGPGETDRRHMNPAELIYEWSLSDEYGARVPIDEINVPALQSAAETLYNEDNGWSGIIEQQTSPRAVIENLLRQIDAVFDPSPSLGMTLRLIRRDYTFGSLRTLDRDNITSVTDWSPGTYEETFNKVIVPFNDINNNSEARPAIYSDPANLQVQDGREAPVTMDYLGVGDYSTANMLATRDGRALSVPRASMTCDVHPSFGRLAYQGEVVKLAWELPTINRVMRIVGVEPATHEKPDYTLELLEDQFATGIRTFGEPGPSDHVDPGAGLDTAPPSAAWDTATFPPDGLRFDLTLDNTNNFQAMITGGVVFGVYGTGFGGQYGRIYVTEPGGVQTLSPIHLSPDPTTGAATFPWPALAAGVYEFCVQTYSLRGATNGVKVCADITVATIGSPSISPSSSASPSVSPSLSPSSSESPSPSASLSPSSSASPSVSSSASASISPSPSVSPSASTSASVSPSPSVSPSSSASPSLSPSSSVSPSAALAVVGHALIYTGNGATQSISSAEISPDLVIAKRRAGAVGNSWPWTDNVRGVTLELFSDTTGSELTDVNGLTSFDANGFSIGSNSQWNASSEAYLALVLQEVASAFDIVSYSGTGVNRTVAHNLGVVPEMMIVKQRSASGNVWAVYTNTISSPATKFMRLDTNAAPATAATVWNSTAPTSSVFSCGTSLATNANGHDYIAYLFASLNPGAAHGSYTGDGNTNGPAVTIGFKPRFVIIKRTDSTGSWVVFDDARDPSSPHNTYNHLDAGGTTAEAVTTNTAGGVDFLADGFQSIDSAAADINISGATYMYLAIA